MTAPFYRSGEWRAFRSAVLGERNHRCSVPGCDKRATHLDHLATVRDAPARALDRANVQALCHGHHSAKTATRDGGFGNPLRTGATPPLRVRGFAPDGTPLDPGHPWNRKA
jgi:5-methylcytosine-specific restriction endonuclease McrA